MSELNIVWKRSITTPPKTCIALIIHIHRVKESKRQTDRQTDREKDALQFSVQFHYEFLILLSFRLYVHIRVIMKWKAYWQHQLTLGCVTTFFSLKSQRILFVIVFHRIFKTSIVLHTTWFEQWTLNRTING